MITFYTDGGNKVGLGHLIRSINLALTFKEKKTFIIYKKKGDNDINFIKSFFDHEKIKLRIIYKNINNEFRIDKSKIIIFDHPNLSAQVIRSAKKFYKKTVVIDDENFLKKYECDLLINQNPYFRNLGYKINKKTTKLFGSNYTILNNYKFTEKTLDNRKTIKNVLLLFGGTDVNNFYNRIIPKLDRYKLYISSANPFIKKKIKNLSHKKNVFFVNNFNLREVLAKNNIDAVISCCGSTLYELFSMKIPVLGFNCSKDQKNAFNYFSKNKSIIKSNLSSIKNDLKNLSKKKKRIIIKNSQEYFNIRGKYLINKEVLKLLK